MRIETIWQALEAELIAGAGGAWLSRFALPDPRNTLLVAIDTSSRSRALLLPLSAAAIPNRRDWPQCRGLELFAVQLDGESHLGVRLLDNEYSDVFAALAEDIAPRVASAADEKSRGSGDARQTAQMAEVSDSTRRGILRFAPAWSLWRAVSPPPCAASSG